MIVWGFRLALTRSFKAFSPPVVTIFLHHLRWQVEANPSCIDHFIDYGYYGSVAPCSALVDSFVGADGFGGGDVDGG